MDNLTQNSKETQNDDVYKILVDRVLADIITAVKAHI